MSQRITIEIKDKIATCLTESPVVCGNADYIVDFVFDEEWENHEVKTAMFVVNGKAIPQVFTGNACPMPVIQNTLIAWVGVFAGTVDDGTLSTSTPALVKCVPCVTDGDNVPMAPPDDVYNQIIALIEAGMLVGPPGPPGPQGEAGSIKFIPVVKLPDITDPTIDTSAIYVEPLENPDEKNKYGEYIFVNGDWEKLGEITIEVDHSEYVKFTDYASTDKAGVVKAGAGLGMSKSNVGLLYVVGATLAQIDAGASNSAPLTANNIRYAVKKGITTNTETLTDEEKASACEWVGAVKKDASVATNLSPLVYTNDTAKNHYLATNYRDYVVYNIPMLYGGTAGKDAVNAHLLTATPANDYHAANKKYVDDGFVAKPTGSGVIYSDGAGTFSTRSVVSGEPKPWTMVERTYEGRVKVGTPTESNDATTKSYVDGLIAELLARIEALESK